MDTNNIKEVRVSVTTDPKQLASSIALFINDGYTVKTTSIGDSLKNITKAVALMNTFENSLEKYDFQPIMEYVQTNTGIKPAVIFYIKLKEKTN